MRLPRHSALAVAVCLTVVAVACDEPPRCADNACPVGMRCVAASGLCVDDEAGPVAAAPTITGQFRLVHQPGLRHAVAAYVPTRHSIAFIERDGDAKGLAYVAGEAAGDALPPGRNVAAVVDTGGEPHLAWLRPADASLWYAVRSAGSWKRTRLDVLGARQLHEQLTIVLWNGRPAIVIADAVSGALALIAMGKDGAFALQDVPQPDPVDGKPARFGGSLAAAGGAGTITIAWYDNVGGDLIVASRGASWVVSRLAGRAADGSDDGDVGAPCALVRDSKGAIALAYRDRSRNRVMVARSLGGSIQHVVVSDGASPAEAGAVRRRLVGTALDVATLANGRIAVAWQDASRARVEGAVEDAAGGFKAFEVPHGLRPQLRPQLVPRVDGTLLIGWLDLDPTSEGGRLASWLWTAGGGAP